MPRIYAACLASYNAGRLYGRWIDAADADTMREEITAMLAASPTPGAEEYAIHDYDGFPANMTTEHPNLDELAALAALIEEHGAELVSAAYDCTGDNSADALADTLERYIGELHDDRALGEHMIDEGLFASDCPDHLKPYLDAEKIGRDMRFGGDVSMSNGHAFWSN